MRRRIAVLLGTVGLLGAMAVPAIGLTGANTDATQLVATLTGLGEVPPLTTATAGIAHVTIDVDKRLICYDLSVTGRKPVAAHIHEGVDGVNGGVVVDLSAFGKDIRRESNGCTRRVAKSVIAAIANNPAGYYINVHSAQNPGGEVRGQLSN